MTDKRYQVFVSSTYKDLIEERQHVSEQLLRSRCIPSGMELFTASGRPPWFVIKSALDTTDYMILILAGRYGSVGSDGISFTEREYDTAYVLVHFFGYLGRDPDAPPDRDLSGLYFWRDSLGRTGDHRALSRAFLNSEEYKRRRP